MVRHQYFRLSIIIEYKANSEHPLAKAVEYAKKFRDDEESPVRPEARDFQFITGHGVKTTIKNKEIILGNKSLMLDQNVNCIVFDKTGTLTIGKPLVVNTKLLKNMVLRDFYELVAAVEVNSENPMAKAVVEYAKKFRDNEESPVWPEARDFESITGHGVKATIRNKEIIVGNKSLMLDQNVDIPLDAEEMRAEVEGFAQTGILVAIDGELIGVLAISDPLKPRAREVISILKSIKVLCGSLHIPKQPVNSTNVLHFDELSLPLLASQRSRSDEVYCISE
ncbi:hypothetical protein RJ640_023824 [Escallonia rubra]|uniref:Uncharacterized protein n=1 Tax=Escallonia rubra TaxID=112253 RepID=A0AA88URC3_9ASTE|nr:hypothetical protein RJ640_023824 [Escallonia rubra]